MKKIFISLFVIAASLSITSCHKSRTCTCTATTTTAGGSSTTTDVDTWSHVTKHEAASRCVSKKYTTTYGTTSAETVEDCKLK